jgi:hypothetical protein
MFFYYSQVFVGSGLLCAVFRVLRRLVPGVAVGATTKKKLAHIPAVGGTLAARVI